MQVVELTLRDGVYVIFDVLALHFGNQVSEVLTQRLAAYGGGRGDASGHIQAVVLSVLQIFLGSRIAEPEIYLIRQWIATERYDGLIVERI